MFGPVRGPWPDESWKGWWGDEPPYHVPVFVLTHHARAPLTMQGGTTFHFVTGGIHDALAQARAAAGGRDVRVGGGVATVREYLKAGLIDELHLALRPVLLGQGKRCSQAWTCRRWATAANGRWRASAPCMCSCVAPNEPAPYGIPRASRWSTNRRCGKLNASCRVHRYIRREAHASVRLMKRSFISLR